jgi:hypothetical protein
MIGLIGYRYNIKKQQKAQLHQFKYSSSIKVQRQKKTKNKHN